MPTVNEVLILGNLTRDPQQRVTPNGITVAEFGLAMNKKFRGKDGVVKEETTFVDCTCFSGLAENVCRYLHKGSLAFVAGRLKLDTWDDRNSGQKRSKLSVIAEDVQFLDLRRDGRDDSGYQQSQNQKKKQQQPAREQTSNPWEEPVMDEPPF